MEYHSATPKSTDATTAVPARKIATRLPVPVSAGAAFLLTLATTLLIIALAAFLATGSFRPYALSIVAAVSQALSLCTLCFLVVRRCYQERIPQPNKDPKRKQERYWSLLGFGILPSTLASVLVVATLGWSKGSLTHLSGRILGRTTSAYLNITFVVWGLSVLAQASLYAFLAFVGEPAPENAPLPLATVQDAPLEMAEQNRPPTSTTVESNPFRESEFSAPPSPIASEGTNSLRSSLSTVRRPSLSRTRLVGRQHSFPRHSKNPSSDNSSSDQLSQVEGFDSWDTSGVGYHIRETVLQSSPSMKVPILEPIPGSRSPSPAKALEGPFFQHSPPESSPPSPLPQPSFSRPNSPRSPSSEDHIHPLFRTCSPTPPPTASSGTVVTAAPSAGQIVNETMLRRMRSGSVPSSPSLLMRSESFDQFLTSRNPTSPNLGLGLNSRPSTSPKENT